jgi:hypothetical protein
MKTRATLIASVMALTLMASAHVARAQGTVVAKVPFDFAAGNVKLPAGEYSVTASEATRMLLLVNRTDAKVSAIIPANATQASEIQRQSALVFNRYGDSYFLSRVRIEGYSRGRQLVKSEREKEMAMIAKADTEGQVTLIASLSPTTR